MCVCAQLGFAPKTLQTKRPEILCGTCNDCKEEVGVGGWGAGEGARCVTAMEGLMGSGGDHGQPLEAASCEQQRLARLQQQQA
jgi:hypothetical protein